MAADCQQFLGNCCHAKLRTYPRHIANVTDRGGIIKHMRSFAGNRLFSYITSYAPIFFWVVNEQGEEAAEEVSDKDEEK
jgi:hypothetical protein